MHVIQTLLARPEVERLGWVLLHFVWQGAVIAALCAVAFMALRRVSQAGRRRGGAPVGSASGSPESANLRYLIACAALLTMAACLPVTWLCVGHDRVPGARGAAEAPEVWSSRSAVTTPSRRSVRGTLAFTRGDRH